MNRQSTSIRVGGEELASIATAPAVSVSALLAGAIVWGLIWYPYRVLETLGVDGLTAACVTYALAAAVAMRALPRPRLPGASLAWLLAMGMSAGACNLGYVLGALDGVVVRVLLLFYLSPLWTVLLARLLLREHLSCAGAGVIALSLAGAAIMLWQPQLGLPVPQSRAEWFGLGAGFAFALTNVLVRRTDHIPIETKCQAVFLGAVCIGLPAEIALGGAPLRQVAESGMLGWILLWLLGMTLAFINPAVQYGLTRLSASRASVIFLFEIVVAALSSWWLAGESMGLAEWVGGSLIVLASLFSGRMNAS